jgi:hypothetical protein
MQPSTVLLVPKLPRLSQLIEREEIHNNIKALCSAWLIGNFVYHVFSVIETVRNNGSALTTPIQSLLSAHTSNL